MEGTAKVRDIPALWRMEPEREVGLHTGAPAILKQPALSPLTFPPSTPHPRWAAAVFMRLPRGSHHLGQLDPWVARGPQVLWGNFSYRISQFPDRSQAPPQESQLKQSLESRGWPRAACPVTLAASQAPHFRQLCPSFSFCFGDFSLLLSGPYLLPM